MMDIQLPEVDPRDADADAFLGGIALLGGLWGPSLQRIARHLQRRAHPAGTLLYADGDPARELFIVEQGEVEEVVAKGPRGPRPAVPTEVRLDTLRRGDCFGYLSMLDIQPRHATARARTAVSLLVLRYRDLVAIQAADPEAFTLLVMNMAREVARRLRRAHHQISGEGRRVDRWRPRLHAPPAARAPRRSRRRAPSGERPRSEKNGCGFP